MTPLVPLTVAIALLAAPALSAVGHWLPKRADDAAGIVVAAATTALALAVLWRSLGAQLVYWFGDWKPRGNLALGISFTVDPFGAGLAVLTAFLVLAALAFSWRYFDEVGTLYHVLMLLFLGAMCGFALTGDLFNMFVFFELMSTAAFALAAYRVEEAGPLQGAFNFAVTNSIGAFFVLFGTALLYGRTGALNLAQIGRSVGEREPDGLLIAAFVLIAVGFLVKSAAVPFHFWLADAHAVAPAPVCVLFSGVMVELGLYAVVRVYWTVFAGPFGAHSTSVRDVLLGLGVLTGAVGAIMCFLQRHVKRLLAYSTIAHLGTFLIGVALLTPDGLAGSAVYVIAHGFAKGALFLCAGILLEQLESVDELHLHGRGRRLPLTAAVWFAATLALAGLPFLGTWSGHALIEDAATAGGHGWVAPVLAAVTLVSTGAILRAGLRVFLGWGPAEDPLLSREPDEKPEGRTAGRPPALLAAPAAVLAALALAVGALNPLSTHAQQAAERFQDRTAYAAAVLDRTPLPAIPLPRHVTTSASVVWGLVSAAGAIAVAMFGLYRDRLPARLRERAARALEAPIGALRLAHSGHVGDYVAWLTLGAAVLGGLLAVGLA